MHAELHPSSHPLPTQLKRVLSLLPKAPGSRLFVTALNLALLPRLPDDVRAMLAGRRLRIRAPDAGLAFDFTWNGRAFAPLASGAKAELVISASVRDFAQLAARKEDPDTLFFSRRLLMEGDTELGLVIKNTLDAIDGPLFEPSQLAPRRVLSALRPGRSGRAGAASPES